MLPIQLAVTASNKSLHHSTCSVDIVPLYRIFRLSDPRMTHVFNVALPYAVKQVLVTAVTWNTAHIDFVLPTLLRMRVSEVPSVYYKPLLSSIDCQFSFPFPNAVKFNYRSQFRNKTQEGLSFLRLAPFSRERSQAFLFAIGKKFVA